MSGFNRVYPSISTPIKVGVGAAIGVGIWEAFKYGIAVFGAPESGGASLSLLAIP